MKLLVTHLLLWLTISLRAEIPSEKTDPDPAELGIKDSLKQAAKNFEDEMASLIPKITRASEAAKESFLALEDALTSASRSLKEDFLRGMHTLNSKICPELDRIMGCLPNNSLENSQPGSNKPPQAEKVL